MTRAARAAALAAILVALPVLAGAQELARLFPREADVFTAGDGLARLPLPPEVLEACAPDLADLRLLDREGREVPYLVDAGAPVGSERLERRTAEARVLDLSRSEQPRDGGKAATREVLRLALPDAPPAGDAWTLVVRSDRPRFVRTAEVRGVEGDGTQVVLVPRASLVRLGQRLADRTEIPLPRFAGKELVLEIDGEEGFFLEPVVSFESDRALPSGEAIEVPLRILDQRRGPGRTVLEVARPPGLVPGHLRIATATPALDRSVVVWDVLPGASPSRLGDGRLLRAAAPRSGAAHEPGQAGVDSLDVAIGVARGDRLRLEIEDGDSPPLAELAIAAVVRQPALVFALPRAPAEQPAGRLLFGGDRARRPRYDLAELFRDAPAAGSARLEDAAALPVAHLGGIRANPQFDAGPALAAVMRPGAALDVRPWRWEKPLHVPASPEGLVRVALGADDVARARDDRGDLRVVDGEQRQWPYIAVPARREAVALEVGGPTTEKGESRWTLRAPEGPLPLETVVLTPTRPVLARPYRLETTAADGRRTVLVRGTLAQDLRQPGPLAVDLPGGRLAELDLVVSDGDDAPFGLARAEGTLALPDLMLAAPEGDYRLLVGNPDATRPQYELERARGVVLGLRSVGAGLEGARQNPVYDPSASPEQAVRERDRLTRLAVWVVIAAAVIALLAITLRVARTTAPGSGG